MSMRKILRMFLVCLMTMFCGTVMAQTTIWSEDWSNWEDKAKTNLAGINPNYTFTGTVLKDGVYSSGTTIYKENLAGGDSPELLIAKSGGSFTAKVALNGATGEMNLAYKANYDRITVTISPSTVTLGEKTKTGNDYLIPVTVPSGVSEIELTFTNSNSSNVRFDDVKLYQGVAKKPAGLSWGTASRSVTLGAEDNNFPTLTNENNLPITYTSSETSVATINTNGEITLVAAGETKITASFAGNDEYEAGEVTYTLTVKEAGGTTPSEITEITVAKALEITNALENGKTTTEEYKVKGFIVGTPDFQRRDDNTLYGNVNLTIADEKGGSTTLTIFRGKYFNDANFTEETITTLKEGDEVVFQGKLQKYVKGEEITPELTSCYLISVNGKTEPETPAVTIGEASDISEFIGLENGKPYKLTLENAQVVYSWTSDSGNTQAFVRDDSGAICFYFTKPDESLAANFTTNKMLNGSIIMNNTLYNGLPEATVTSETNTEKLTFSDGSDAQPIKITAAEVSKNLNDLVLLENVTITENEGKYYVDDVQVYNGFHFDAFNDLSSFVGEGKTIKGIALVNNTTYRILPIEITSQGGGETPTTNTIYSWSADSEGNITEIGGKAKATDGESVGFSNKGYTTIRVSTKKADVATSNIEITLDKPLEKGDVITVTGYKNKNENGKLVSLFIQFEKGEPFFNDEETWVNICDNDGIDFDNDGNTPNTNTYSVAEDAAGSKTIKLSRSKANTNLFITSFVITRGSSSGIQNVVKPVVENGIRYNLAGQRVDENYKGVVIMNGKKYVVK